jgi:murein DD-endopeptidase MepM/ murein hydrolase activator NlpD
VVAGIFGGNPRRVIRRAPALGLLLFVAGGCAQNSSTYTSSYHYTSSATYRSSLPFTSYSSAPLSWPLSEGVVSSRYGIRHGRMHKGIDIAAPVGTRVLAAESGDVIFAGKIHGYGRTVILRHDAHRVTLYAHNRSLRVYPGQRVRRGQVIATVGSSGHASGPNLHFEVRIDSHTQNPLLYLEPHPHLVTFAKRTNY